MRRIKAHFVQAGPQKPRGYLLGIDFDGTLAPLARRPEQARLPPDNRRLLRRLIRLRRVMVAVVTGRALADIKRKISMPGVIYVGNHGLEIQMPQGHVWVHPQAKKLLSLMRALTARLKDDLKEFPGVQIENKGLTLSVHYRRLPRYLSPRPIHEQIVLATSAQRHRVRVSAGKKVWEVRPLLEWNKGFAIRRLLLRFPQWTPVFIGDDATDEEGFRSLGPQALTVRVGYARGSAARFRVKNQRQVKDLLSYFAREWR